MSFKSFRVSNGLTQNQVADYLGTTRSFISLVETGSCPLPSEKLKALMDNTMGWDVSQLTIETDSTGDADVCTVKKCDDVAVLRKENEMLRKQIDMLTKMHDDDLAQIQFLRSLILK